LPAHAGTRHVPVVVVHALIREDQTTHCTCHGMIYIEYCLFIIHEIINKQKSKGNGGFWGKGFLRERFGKP
jgi:hypothetical protein